MEEVLCAEEIVGRVNRDRGVLAVDTAGALLLSKLPNVNISSLSSPCWVDLQISGISKAYMLKLSKFLNLITFFSKIN